MRSRGLKPKHLKALELLAEGKLSVEKVAELTKTDRSHLYRLIADDPVAGPVAHEFSEALKKKEDDIGKKTEGEIKQLKARIVTFLSDWFTHHVVDPKNIPQNTHKQVIEVLNALTKATPQINIGNLSYTTGLTGEDLSNEFRRLNALARSALNREPISSAEQGEQGLLSPSAEAGSVTEEDKEASDVRSESQAGDVPQV